MVRLCIKALLPRLRMSSINPEFERSSIFEFFGSGQLRLEFKKQNLAKLTPSVMSGMVLSIPYEHCILS